MSQVKISNIVCHLNTCIYELLNFSTLLLGDQLLWDAKNSVILCSTSFTYIVEAISDFIIYVHIVNKNTSACIISITLCIKFQILVTVEFYNTLEIYVRRTCLKHWTTLDMKLIYMSSRIRLYHTKSTLHLLGPQLL